MGPGLHMHPGPGLQTPRTPDSRFPEKIWSTGAPDSRLQISRENLEYPGPDSRFPEKIWSTGAPDSRLQISRKNLEYRGPGLQTPDFQKKSGVPGPRTPDSRFPEKIWSTRGPRLQITDSRIWSPGSRYSRFFWKSGVWSLEILQIFSGNLESGVWSLEVLQIFSGNLESGVWGYSRFFLEIWSLESRPSQNQPSRGQMCGSWGGGGGRANIPMQQSCHQNRILSRTKTIRRTIE